MKRKRTTLFGINLKAKRTSVAIRFMGYGFMAAVAVIAAGILVATAQGYDINRDTGDVIQNGLILIDSEPVAGDIFVNDVSENDAAPGRLPLPEGSYNIDLRRDGYHWWSKQIDLVGSEVVWLYYPLLVPTEIQTTLLQSFNTIDFIKQSPDSRWLIVHTTAANNKFVLVDLENPLDAPRSITVPKTAFTRQKGKLGKIRFSEWGQDNSHFLLKHTIAQVTEFISVDRGKPAEAVNINRVSQLSIDDLHYKANQSGIFYANIDGTIREVRASGDVAAPVFTNAADFEVHGSGKLLIVERDADGSHWAVLWDKGKTKRFQRLSASAVDYFLRLDNYDGKEYLVVASNDDKELNIYRQPTKTLNSDGEPKIYRTLMLDSANPRTVSFSASNQFVGMQRANEFVVFDFEKEQEHRFKANVDMADNTAANWMDGHRFIMFDKQKMAHIIEYDGANQQSLVSGSASPGAFFDRSYETIYTIDTASTSKKKVLQSSSLIVE